MTLLFTFFSTTSLTFQMNKRKKNSTQRECIVRIPFCNLHNESAVFVSKLQFQEKAKRLKKTYWFCEQAAQIILNFEFLKFKFLKLKFLTDLVIKSEFQIWPSCSFACFLQYMCDIPEEQKEEKNKLNENALSGGVRKTNGKGSYFTEFCNFHDEAAVLLLFL